MTSLSVTVTELEQVAAWPRIRAVVRADGTGALTINGTERPCAAASLEELRVGVIARCAELARLLNRPVRLVVDEAPNIWTLAVRGNGVVQVVDAAGTVEPADDLAPQEGRCRICRRLQPVSVSACVQCGTAEPHRVESSPGHEGPEGPEGPEGAVAPPLTPPAPPPGPPGRPPTRRLRLVFSSQPAVEAAAGVAIGRNPQPVGGRQPVRVASPKRMLSRTHALIDVDETGRIVVTDHHSGNGVEAQTEPPTLLTPGAPYVVAPGTTLLMGDVAVTINHA